ncbi:MAG: hypothetical protein JO332_09460 [Planctomycetaceae bacterium]|nr:hypothetical protein [Planctomycetaceae bacterium]
MDRPVKQTGTLDALDRFGVEFEGLVPGDQGWMIGLRCFVCNHRWTTSRTRMDFEREATECPKSQTSKKHIGIKGSNKKS